ncbi:MAG: VOC family protein [Deltaproteobacteria bacterium]|nr:VOC family protein [Deltaproteobacteria bacterium]
MQQGSGQYNVGGVLLPRPFKVRRLGHFGFNLSHLEEGVRFYTQLLGFRLTDELDLSKIPELPRPEIPGVRGVFFACGRGEIHLVEQNSRFMQENIAININPHVALTVESVAEVKRVLQQEGIAFFESARNPLGRQQIFVQDPDGNVLEITDYRPGS